MGKTIMLSALIQTNLPDQQPEENTIQSKGKQLRLNNAFRPVRRSAKPPTATLVVAPTSLLHQWEDELQRSSKPGTLDIFVWHGQNRLDLEDVLENDDDDKGIKVVITSYGVLSSEHAKMDRSTSTKPQVFDSECDFVTFPCISYFFSNLVEGHS
jgi:DNA repair protein RAD5